MPPIVDLATWDAARATLLELEKAHTRATDALAAQRRDMPMVRVERQYELAGAAGAVTLLDLFEGRRQLVLYLHMLTTDDAAPCPGCSSFLDGVARLEQTHVMDVTFAAIADAPYEQFAALRDRLDWQFPVYSSLGTSFREDWNRNPWSPQSFGLSVFLRDGAEIYQTYFTFGRGVEQAGSMGFLDIVPFGRQKAYEQSPSGWPQEPTYSRGQLHDTWSDEELSGATAPSSTGTPLALDDV